jgi:hypothetical protein
MKNKWNLIRYNHTLNVGDFIGPNWKILAIDYVKKRVLIKRPNSIIELSKDMFCYWNLEWVK